ncbi:MAG: flagellar basal body P-ring formation protein FlgA [Deltaproteobacteria bacterium]|nr:flagellar basal body P-ring formation protein FlgA [Deltaproteobacteria bacterium]
MTAFRGGILAFLLALAAVLPAGAGAASPSPEAILRAHVLEHRPWSDVEVRNLSLDAVPPVGTPRRILVRKGLPGRTVFSMEYGNGVVVTATADVAAFEEIVLTARQLWKNRPLTEDDVCLARTEIGRVPAGAVRDREAVVGKILNRSVGANLPVLSRYLAGSKVVKRGRKVTLLVESGGMRIATRGETRENAYVDDVVKVVNLASNKTVTGILVDENTVRVDF